MFIYQCKMIKLFLCIFRRFIRLIRIFFNMFSDPENWLPGSGDRPARSTVCQSRSTGRSTGPLGCQTCTRLCTSVDRSVDRPLVRSIVRSTDLACQPQPGSETRSEKQLNIFLKILLSLVKIP